MVTLREVRERKGMTQQALAAAAGVALSSVSEIEAGRTRPRIDTARAIASALGASLDELWPPEPIPAPIITP